MIKTILTNWKTSGVALLTAVLGLLNYLFPEKFTTELNTSLLGVLVILGGLLAKDASVVKEDTTKETSK